VWPSVADLVAAIAVGAGRLVGIGDGSRIVGCVRALSEATARAVIDHLEALGVVGPPGRPTSLRYQAVGAGPVADRCRLGATAGEGRWVHRRCRGVATVRTRRSSTFVPFDAFPYSSLSMAGNEGLAEERPDEADLALERPSRLLLAGTATAAVALIAISAFTFLTNADDEDETPPPAVEPAPSPRSAVTLAP
jgi:hypothetical protein